MVNKNNIKNVEGFVGFKPAPEEPQYNSKSAGINRSTTFLSNVCGTKKIRIENNVYTTKLKRKLNLKLLYKYFKEDYGPQYNHKNFAALIIRYRDPRAAALIYGSGDIVFTGVKNPFQAKIMLIDILKIIQEAGYIDIDWEKISLKLQNMVASVTLNFGLDLKRFSKENPDICDYIKDIFPGAIVKSRDLLGKISVTLFDEGKLNITGGKDYHGIKRAIQVMMPILSNYRIEISQPDCENDESEIESEFESIQNNKDTQELKEKRRKTRHILNRMKGKKNVNLKSRSSLKSNYNKSPQLNNNNNNNNNNKVIMKINLMI
jgi:transcription initiation factor TFIID TATA-box-binding protein